MSGFVKGHVTDSRHHIICGFIWFELLEGETCLDSSYGEITNKKVLILIYQIVNSLKIVLCLKLDKKS